MMAEDDPVFHVTFGDLPPEKTRVVVSMNDEELKRDSNCDIPGLDVIPDSVKLTATWPQESCGPQPGDRSKTPTKQSIPRDENSPGDKSPTRGPPERLVSPTRRSYADILKRFEAKQAKAAETRKILIEEKVQRSKLKSKKFEEIKAWSQEKTELQQQRLNLKLQKAEELRQQNLEKIKKAAHDEELKVSEIHFINEIEAQNKRHDMIMKDKDFEMRRSHLQEESHRKRKEQNILKEAAAEDRKKALEAEHQAKIHDLKEKIKAKDEKLKLEMIKNQQERMINCQKKEKCRQNKIHNKKIEYEKNVEELQRKIQQKLEGSEKRKQENMSQIRQKAFESSVKKFSEQMMTSGLDFIIVNHPNENAAPRSIPYETQKMCIVCKVLIGSEIYLYSHLRGKKHQDAIKEYFQEKTSGDLTRTMSCEELELYNIKHIIDAPAGSQANDFNPELATMNKERLKSFKKRCSRLRQKMMTKGSAFESSLKQNTHNSVKDQTSTGPSSKKSRQHLEKPSSPSENKLKISKNLKDIQKIVAEMEQMVKSNPKSDSHVLSPNMIHSLERSISCLVRILTRMTADHKDQKRTLENNINTVNQDKMVFKSLDGLSILTSVLFSGSRNEKWPEVPEKIISKISHLLLVTCAGHPENSSFFFNSNCITTTLDFLERRLTVSPLVSSSFDLILWYQNSTSWVVPVRINNGSRIQELEPLLYSWHPFLIQWAFCPKWKSPKQRWIHEMPIRGSSMSSGNYEPWELWSWVGRGNNQIMIRSDCMLFIALFML